MPLLTFIICLLISASVAAVGGGGLDTPLQVRGLFAISLLVTNAAAKIILNARNYDYAYPAEWEDTLPDGFWFVVFLLSGSFTGVNWIIKGLGIYGPLDLAGLLFDNLVGWTIIAGIIVKIRSI